MSNPPTRSSARRTGDVLIDPAAGHRSSWARGNDPSPGVAQGGAGRDLPGPEREGGWNDPGELHLPNLLGVVALHLVTITLAVPTFSLGALLVMLGLTYLVCLGWSVGLHRGNVHRSYECPRWVRYVLSYLGTLAGIGGPIHMWHSHNFRDYYQSLADSPDIHGYHTGFFHSFYNILLSRSFPAEAEPVPEEVLEDRFFQFLDRTNLLQQIPVGALLYLVGGWPYVVWGIFVRLTVSIDLFAAVNYFGHTSGYRSFGIPVCAEEGRNNPVLGFVAVGEGWHNNHHAYPSSAKIGLSWWELDIGYLCIRAMEACGLAWNVRTPRNLPLRPGAIALRSSAEA